MSSTNALTSGRRLVRSTAWNLVAYLLPLLVALVCIPLIIESAGVQRFGVLALGWALIGYSGMFDLGLGRALTRLVAERLGTDPLAVKSAIKHGLGFMFVAGLIGSALLFALTDWLVQDILNIADLLRDEAKTGFQLIAVAVPILTLSIGLRGVLEAYQEFRTIAVISSIVGVITFVGPLVALSVEQSAAAMIAAVVVARLFGMAAYGLVIGIKLATLESRPGAAGFAKAFIRFGSWMTVSNVISPFMDYMDRFIIGAMLSVSAVAYYATPFDIVSRLGTIAGAVSGVLFPAFAMSLANDRERAKALYAGTLRHLLLILCAPVLILSLFADTALLYWLGPDFAEQSTWVVRWLAVAFLINALARIPFALLQAANRPDITAKLHLAELPLYLLAVWLFVSQWCIAGAAAAWCLRATLDTVLLMYLSKRLAHMPLSNRGVIFGALAIIGLTLGASFWTELGEKLLYLAVSGAALFYIARRWLLAPGELSALLGHIRARKTP